MAPEIAEEKMLQQRCFEGFNIKPQKDFLQSRAPLLVNNDLHLVLAAPQESLKVQKGWFTPTYKYDEKKKIEKNIGILDCRVKE